MVREATQKLDALWAKVRRLSELCGESGTYGKSGTLATCKNLVYIQSNPNLTNLKRKQFATTERTVLTSQENTVCRLVTPHAPHIKKKQTTQNPDTQPHREKEERVQKQRKTARGRGTERASKQERAREKVSKGKQKSKRDSEHTHLLHICPFAKPAMHIPGCFDFTRTQLCCVHIAHR